MKTTNIASAWPLLLALTLGLYLLEFATPAEAAPKKLLVVTVTKGFIHSSIPTAQKILRELAQNSGDFTVDYVRDDAEIEQKIKGEPPKNSYRDILPNTNELFRRPDNTP